MAQKEVAYIFQAIRLAFGVSCIIVVTSFLYPWQWLSMRLNIRGAKTWIPLLYHRIISAVLGIRAELRGAIATNRPLLIVSNHASWLDVVVISKIAPVTFIAKEEVASWPVFGQLAKLQESIFISRNRPLETYEANVRIAERLLCGDAIVLFAEGTSSDGTEVLPFRSALVGSAAVALLRSGMIEEVYLQPLCITYASPTREVVAWAREDPIGFLPHLLRVVMQGHIEVVVSWGKPLAFNVRSDRKLIARELEQTVRVLMHEATNSKVQS